MGGGPGAGSIIIQFCLLIIISIPTHIVSCMYLKKSFVVQYLLVSFAIAVVAMLFPFCLVFYFGTLGEYSPSLVKYFVLNISVALFTGADTLKLGIREKRRKRHEAAIDKKS